MGKERMKTTESKVKEVRENTKGGWEFSRTIAVMQDDFKKEV